MKKLFFLWVLLWFSFVPKQAYSCLCCADAGEWHYAVEKLPDDKLEAFRRLKFSDVAELAAGEHQQDIKGVSIKDSELFSNFKLNVNKDGRQWVMRFEGFKQSSGELILSIPHKVVHYRVDMQDESNKGLGPKLYKEYRLHGKIKGNGMFDESAHSNAKFDLILQERGNLCLNSQEIYGWILIVKGEKVSYSFHGKFVRDIQKSRDDSGS